MRMTESLTLEQEQLREFAIMGQEMKAAELADRRGEEEAMEAAKNIRLQTEAEAEAEAEEAPLTRRGRGGGGGGGRPRRRSGSGGAGETKEGERGEAAAVAQDGRRKTTRTSSRTSKSS